MVSIFHIWCIIETFILKLYQMLKIMSNFADDYISYYI